MGITTELSQLFNRSWFWVLMFETLRWMILKVLYKFLFIYRLKYFMLFFLLFYS